MKSSLKAFGATLHQVCASVGEKLGIHAVSDESKTISLAVAASKASPKNGAGESSLTLKDALPIFIRKPETSSIRAFSVALAAAAAMSSPVMAIAQTYDKDGRSENNTASRIAGGVAGALLGNLLGKDANAFWKPALTLGGAYAGQTVGDMATRTPIDQNGQPVVQNGVDADGRPVYIPLASANPGSLLPKPGARPPANISQSAYNEAIRISSGFQPAPAQIGIDGQQWRALTDQVHVSLYNMMVDAVASRAVAKLANNDLDSAELARAVAPGDAKRVAEFTVANQAYANAFRAYSQSFQQANQALAIAERNGFNVSAQRVLMATIPGDLKQSTPNVSWPRLDDAIRAKALESQAGSTAMLASYGETVALSKVAKENNTATESNNSHMRNRSR